MTPAPGVEGWTRFGSRHEEHMFEVRQHADALAANIRSGAREGARTDADSGGGFAEAGGLLSACQRRAAHRPLLTPTARPSPSPPS